MAPFRVALLACLGAVTAGCSPYGLIYTHKFEPLTTDFHATPAAIDEASGDVKEISYYVRVLWNCNGIGDIAKKHGFEKVYYADLETLSVFGIWKQEWALVYGTKKVAATGAP
jgi:hypothetical protein